MQESFLTKGACGLQMRFHGVASDLYLGPKSWVVSVQCPLSCGFDLMLPSFSLRQNGIRSCFNKDAANADDGACIL